MNMLKKLGSIGFIKYYLEGKKLLNNEYYQIGQEKNKLESLKIPPRSLSENRSVLQPNS